MTAGGLIGILFCSISQELNSDFHGVPERFLVYLVVIIEFLVVKRDHVLRHSHGEKRCRWNSCFCKAQAIGSPAAKREPLLLRSVGDGGDILVVK